MRKLLIIITCIASLYLTGCQLVHKIDVQQGNVVTQEMVDQLEPGMTRNQVQFIMGSPMVVDVFHQARWDYIYYLKPGYGEKTEERVSVFFQDDLLVQFTSTLKPAPSSMESDDESRQMSVVVPAYPRVEPGLFNKIWHWITFRKPEEP